MPPHINYMIISKLPKSAIISISATDKNGGRMLHTYFTFVVKIPTLPKCKNYLAQSAEFSFPALYFFFLGIGKSTITKHKRTPAVTIVFEHVISQLNFWKEYS